MLPPRDRNWQLISPHYFVDPIDRVTENSKPRSLLKELKLHRWAGMQQVQNGAFDCKKIFTPSLHTLSSKHVPYRPNYAISYPSSKELQGQAMLSFLLKLFEQTDLFNSTCKRLNQPITNSSTVFMYLFVAAHFHFKHCRGHREEVDRIFLQSLYKGAEKPAKIWRTKARQSDNAKTH